MKNLKNDPDGKTDHKLKEGKTPEILQKLKDGGVTALEKQFRKKGELEKANKQFNTKRNRDSF